MKTEHSKKKINKKIKNLEEKQSVKHWTLSTRLLRNEKVLGFRCPLGKGKLGYGDIQKFTGHQSKTRQEKRILEIVAVVQSLTCVQLLATP